MEPLKTTGDLASVSVLVATFLNYLPALAAGATLIWTLIRIYETETCKKFIRWVGRKLLRKLDSDS